MELESNLGTCTDSSAVLKGLPVRSNGQLDLSPSLWFVLWSCCCRCLVRLRPCLLVVHCWQSFLRAERENEHRCGNTIRECREDTSYHARGSFYGQTDEKSGLRQALHGARYEICILSSVAAELLLLLQSSHVYIPRLVHHLHLISIVNFAFFVVSFLGNCMFETLYLFLRATTNAVFTLEKKRRTRLVSYILVPGTEL